MITPHELRIAAAALADYMAITGEPNFIGIYGESPQTLSRKLREHADNLEAVELDAAKALEEIEAEGVQHE